jgi:PAS domain-containing protein
VAENVTERKRAERQLHEAEVRYRTLVEQIPAVTYIDAVDNAATGEKLFDSMAPAGGFGFRVLLNKRSRTNLCTDWGWGKEGSHGLYLAIQEAF